MRVPALSAAEIALLRGVFRSHPEVTEVLLFGSRAKGTQAANSGIDLALCGDVSPIQAQAIAAELDDLPLPYQYDVQPFNSINSVSLRDHITRVGIQLYPETPSQRSETGGMPAAQIEACLQDLTGGRTDFWTVVRETSTENLRALITLALRQANGSYRRVAALFHLNKDDYGRFMDSLRRRHCAIDHRPFVSFTSQPARDGGD